VPSVHLVWRGRRSGTTGGGRVRALHGTFGGSRTMLSMPLACPSTLDRRLRRPTWRGVGARRSCCFEKIAGKSSR